MSFREPNSEKEKEKASELSRKLCELILETNTETLEAAIRLMGANTRDTLLRGIREAERNEGPGGLESAESKEYRQ
jgi:tRNA nucleotidyltransferase (CCA-adding enzyme)